MIRHTGYLDAHSLPPDRLGPWSSGATTLPRGGNGDTLPRSFLDPGFDQHHKSCMVPTFRASYGQGLYRSAQEPTVPSRSSAIATAWAMAARAAAAEDEAAAMRWSQVARPAENKIPLQTPVRRSTVRKHLPHHETIRESESRSGELFLWGEVRFPLPPPPPRPITILIF